MVTETKEFNPGQAPPVVERRDKGNVLGAVEAMGGHNLAREFISAARTLIDAIAKTVLLTRDEANDVAAWADWQEEFGVSTRPLVFFLLTRPSIGGYNLARASMTETGIIVPEGLGVPINKHGADAFRAQSASKQALQNKQLASQRGEQNPD